MHMMHFEVVDQRALIQILKAVIPGRDLKGCLDFILVLWHWGGMAKECDQWLQL